MCYSINYLSIVLLSNPLINYLVCNDYYPYSQIDIVHLYISLHRFCIGYYVYNQVDIVYLCISLHRFCIENHQNILSGKYHLLYLGKAF